MGIAVLTLPKIQQCWTGGQSCAGDMMSVNMIPLSLDGQTAIVTGAGRGIGQAIARKLAAAGARVVINDLDEGAAAESVEAVRSSGGQGIAVPGDVTEAAFPTKLADAAVARFGSIDIVVNNAGYTWDTVIQKTTDEQFQAMLDIHLTAPFRVLRAASNWIREAAKRETAEDGE